jgi:hypothetical protein
MVAKTATTTKSTAVFLFVFVVGFAILASDSVENEGR